jgi:hypothetical protein
MRIFKLLILFAFSLFLLIVMLGLIQPSSMSVNQSSIVASQPCAVFNGVNQLQNRTQWSPWHNNEQEIAFGKIGSGEGASYSWSSPGEKKNSIRYTQVEENVRIEAEYLFEKYGLATEKWLFEKTVDGTKVSWTFEMQLGNNPFKRLQGVMLKAAIQGSLNQGLENLNAFCQSPQTLPCE